MRQRAALIVTAAIAISGMVSVSTATATHDDRLFTGDGAEFFDYEPPPGDVGEPGELVRFQPWTSRSGEVTPDLYRMLFWSTVQIIGNPDDADRPDCGWYSLSVPPESGVTETEEVRCERRIVTSGLARIPSASPPPGGFPTLAFSHGTLGVLPKCGQSRWIGPKWIDENESATAKTVAADYPGLGYDSGLRSFDAGHRSRHPWWRWLHIRPFDEITHTYGEKRSTGTSTVDAVRASQQLEAALAGLTSPSGDIGTNNAFAVFGSSQGGQGALSTGQVMAEGYAPELDLRAVLAGAPASNLGRTTSTDVNVNLAQGLFAAGLVGASVTDPAIRPSEIFTEIGKANYNRTSEKICSGTDTFESYLWWINALYSYPFVSPLDELVARPEWQRYSARQDVGNQTIDAPILIGQVTGDPIVDIERTELLIDQFRNLEADLDVTYCVFEGNGATGVSYQAVQNHTTVKQRMFAGDARDCQDLAGTVTGGGISAGAFLEAVGISGFDS